MKNDKISSLHDRIRELYDDMSEGDRQLADIAMEFPADLLMYSATELADRAGVSKATVSRFVRRLGYKSFKGMRDEIRGRQAAGDPVFVGRSDVGALSSSEALQSHLENDVANLKKTIETTDPKIIEAASTHIIRAKRVYCLGFRNGAFFAGYMQRQLLTIRRDVVLLPTFGQTLGEDLGSVDRDALVIVFGLRRRASALLPVMKLLHDREIPTLYFTNQFADRHAISSLSLATYTLACAVEPTWRFDSYVGLVSLVNLVCTNSAVIGGREAQETMRNVETMLRDLNEIDSER